jgi:HeH/LEM domain
MDSKLKALKVVDLRAILAKANVSCPAKANKQDLIARIIASPPAIKIYHQLYTQKCVSFINISPLLYLTFVGMLMINPLQYYDFILLSSFPLTISFRLNKYPQNQKHQNLLPQLPIHPRI